METTQKELEEHLEAENVLCVRSGHLKAAHREKEIEVERSLNVDQPY